MDYNSKSGKQNFDISVIKDNIVPSEDDDDEFSIPSFTPEDIKDLISLGNSPKKDQSIDSLESEARNLNLYKKTYNFVPSVLTLRQGTKSLGREQKKPDSEITRRLEYREHYQEDIQETSNKEGTSDFINNDVVDIFATEMQDSAFFEKKVYCRDGQSEISEKTTSNMSTNLDDFAEKNVEMSENKKLLVPEKSVVQNLDLSQMSHDERVTVKENKHHSKTYSDRLSHNRDGSVTPTRDENVTPTRDERVTPTRDESVYFSPNRIKQVISEQYNADKRSTKAHKQQEKVKSKYSSRLDSVDRDGRSNIHRYDDKFKYSRTWATEKHRKDIPSTNRYNRPKETKSKVLERDRKKRCSPDMSDGKSLKKMNTKSRTGDYIGMDKSKENESSIHVSESEASIQNKTQEINTEPAFLLDKFDGNLRNVKYTNKEKDGENIDQAYIKNDDKLKTKGIYKDEENSLSSDKHNEKTINFKDEGLESNRERRRSFDEVTINLKRKEQGESRSSFGSYDDKTLNFQFKNTDKYRYSIKHEDRYSRKRNKRSKSRSLSPKKYPPRKKRRTRSTSRSSSSSYSSFSSSPERKTARMDRRRRRSLSRSPVNRLDKQWLQSMCLNMPKELSPNVATFPSDINPAPEVEEVKKLQTQRYKFIDEETDLRRELNLLSEQRKQMLKINIADDNPILVENSRQKMELENKVKFIHETVNLLTRKISTLNYLTSKIRMPETMRNVGLTNTRIGTEQNTNLPYGSGPIETVMNSEASQPITRYGIDHQAHPPNNQFHLNEPLQYHSQQTPLEGIPHHNQFQPTQYITDPINSSHRPQMTNPQCITFQHGLNSPVNRIPQPLPINVNQGHLRPVHIVDSPHHLRMTDPHGLQLAHLKPQPSQPGQLPFSDIGKLVSTLRSTNLPGIPLRSVSQTAPCLIEIIGNKSESLNTVRRGLPQQSDLPKHVDKISQSDSKSNSDKTMLDEIFDEWSDGLTKKTKSDVMVKEVINLSDSSSDSTSFRSANGEVSVLKEEGPQLPVGKSSFNSFVFKLSPNETKDFAASSSMLCGNKTSTENERQLPVGTSSSNSCFTLSANKTRDSIASSSMLFGSKTSTEKEPQLLMGKSSSNNVFKLSANETRDSIASSSTLFGNKTSTEKEPQLPVRKSSFNSFVFNLTTKKTKDSAASSSTLFGSKTSTEVMSATQKRFLMEQRNTYIHKRKILHRDLDFLTEHCKLMTNENLPPSDPFFKNNEEKQVKIREDLEALQTLINNLTSMIGDNELLSEDPSVFKKENLTKDLNEELKKSETNVRSDDKLSDTNDFRFNHQDENASKTTAKPNDASFNSSKNEEKLSTYLNQDSSLKSKNMSATTYPNSVESNHREESHQSVTNKQQFNYIHYDPEMHWCRVCNVFPKTAKAYLNHLHSAEHKDIILQKKLIDLPWHENENSPEKAEHVPGAPIKRVAIKGLQFFVSATAWYCKICSTWIGDLHCASIHLKSSLHSEKYAIFTQENPEWEMEWLIERTRAFENSTKNQLQAKEEAPVKDLQVGGMVKQEKSAPGSMNIETPGEKIFNPENPESEMGRSIERTRAFENSTKNQLQVKEEAPFKDLWVGSMVTYDVIKQEKSTPGSKETSTTSMNIEVPGEKVTTILKRNTSKEFPVVDKRKKSSEIIDSVFKESKNRLPINDLPLAQNDKQTKDGRNKISTIEEHKLNSKEILEAKEFSSSSDSDDDMSVKLLEALKEIKKIKMLSETNKPSSSPSDKLISVLKEIRETSSKTAIKSNKSSVAASDSDTTFIKQLISVTKNLKKKTENAMHQVKKRKKSSETSSSNDSSSSDSSSGDVDLDKNAQGALRSSHPEEEQVTVENKCIIPEPIENEYKTKKDTFKEDLLNNMFELQKRKDLLKKIKNEDNSEREINSEHGCVKLDGEQNETSKSKEDKSGSDKNKTVRKEDKYSKNMIDTKVKNIYSKDSTGRYSNRDRRYMDSSSGSNRYRSENQSSRIEESFHNIPDSTSNPRSNRYGRGDRSKYPVGTNNDKDRKRTRIYSEGKDMTPSDDVKLESCGTANSNNSNLEVNKLEEKLDKEKHLFSEDVKSTEIYKNLTESEKIDFDKLDIESAAKKTISEIPVPPLENVSTNTASPSVFNKIGPIKFSIKNKISFKNSKTNAVTHSVFDSQNV